MNRYSTRSIITRSCARALICLGSLLTVTLLVLATGSSTVATEGASPTSTSSRMADLD
ncbi:MAG: hypothetical protein QOF73_1232 [Thermomicrobiales bacterium]|nr:hypothetical protein [Thermomicrobiales bacterium]